MTPPNRFFAQSFCTVSEMLVLVAILKPHQKAVQCSHR